MGKKKEKPINLNELEEEEKSMRLRKNWDC